MISLIDFKDIVYKDKGRVYPEFDCYGFISYLYKKEHNIDITDFEYKSPNDVKNEKLYYESLKTGAWESVEPQKGVVVALKVNGYISHVGFMLNSKEFIHIMAGSGVRINKITSPQWKNRIVGFYRYA